MDRHPPVRTARRMSQDELLNELVYAFAREHRYADVMPELREIGCRAGPPGVPTEPAWHLEMQRCTASLKEKLQDMLEEHDMFLMMGEFDAAITPPTPKEDDSWVQLAQNSSIMWIVKVGWTVVDYRGKLVASRELAHKWHYKKDACVEAQLWADRYSNDVVTVERF